ncbi:endo alpha-1,4 polygalactosaminidase [Nakamurella sp. PAMC28650]|uniref:endo alpha-1,4 polygalactosaminidase n=1 Tax=Nakamurella sp. PAMC28650 TaxID=2762325 RepID=UPI00164E1EE0|nr:endo alpha-1,4 polygalactosaminidase [Nakamurella sp. PAMC28650]QNK81982.1 endo alpha-1,4 polygalactosaminidase [Nakamurella sp. PAMC28650]
MTAGEQRINTTPGIRRSPSRRHVGVLLLALALAVGGCAGLRATPSSAQLVSVATQAVSDASQAASRTSTSTPVLPPAHGRFSYQIGGAYAVPATVTIVDRDRAARAVMGKYSICYVNAFQAQPDAVGWWTRNHPNLLLRRASGSLIVDTAWGEPLLDISTPQKRTSLIGIVGAWIDGCASAGYQAVEADNLDSYTRSEHHLTLAAALAFSTLLTARAHQRHLAIAQKNGAELAAAARRSGFDFAVAEECQVYTECDSYTRVYGPHVIEIEYTDTPGSAFTEACRLRGHSISVVLRDRDVTPAGDPQHVESWCP